MSPKRTIAGVVAAVVEAMERRTLLSAAVLNSSGVLTVTGTAGADHIEVSAFNNRDFTEELRVTVNVALPQVFLAASVSAVVTNAGAGNDTVDLFINDPGGDYIATSRD